MSSETLTPEVLWAQRSNKVDAHKNFIYLTINVPDVSASDIKLDIQPTSVTFTGTSSSLKNTYHVELPLYAEIDPSASALHHTGKNVEMKLQKKELTEKYWPRLLKESKKMHFLKTDFDKWVDEDEQDEAPEEDFSQFGGMGGMPGMGAGGDFGGIDFSKLGGDAGAGAGAMDDDDDDDDGDDDEMPPLEGEEKTSKEPSAEASKEPVKEEAKEDTKS